MSNFKYGDIVYHILTEEPILVIRAFKYATLGRRPIMGSDGIRYGFKFFLNSELESLQEQTARTIANIQSRNAIAGAEFGPENQGPMPALQFKKPS